MKNIKFTDILLAFIALCGIWGFVIVIAVFLAFVFNGEQFILRWILISPCCITGVILSKMVIKEIKYDRNRDV